MTKFKVGDTVRVTHGHRIGQLAPISFVGEDGYVLDFPDGGKLYYVLHEIECPAGRQTEASRKLYLIGSLRNPKVQEIAAEFRKLLPGWEVFDDWQAAGPEADDYWRDYEKAKGHDFAKALEGHAAKHVYEFDKHHLDTSDAAILILPAGKSGHLELGYMVGKGKYTAILLDDDPERFDVMYQFVDKVTRSLKDIVEDLNAKD